MGETPPSFLVVAAPATVALLFFACQDPTQIRLELTTDADCTAGVTTEITVGAPADIEKTKPRASTKRCSSPSGRIGSLVLVPSDDDSAEIAIRVTAGVGVDPSTCEKQPAACIESERRIRFVPHISLVLPIHLQISCLGVSCPAGSTCQAGACVPVACAGQCADAGPPKDGGTDADAQDSAPLVCGVGEADCNGSVADGCEAVLEIDGKNCGACSHDCQGGECVGGSCRPVVLSPTPGAFQTAIRAGTVFFTSIKGAAVQKVDLAGGPTTNLATAQATPNGIAVDDHFVYWTNLNGGTIKRATHTGGNVSDLATGQQGPCGLALSGADVYWTNSGTSAAGWKDGQVQVLPSGGSLATLATARYPCSVAVDAGFVYWADRGDPVQSDLGSVNRIATSGGSVQTLVAGVTADDIALDGAYVYWTNRSSIGRAPRTGGSAETLASGLSIANSLAIDATHLYFTTAGDGRLARILKVGGPVEILATSLAKFPGGVSVDATSICWGVQGESPSYVGAGLMKLAK